MPQLALIVSSCIAVSNALVLSAQRLGHHHVIHTQHGEFMSLRPISLTPRTAAVTACELPSEPPLALPPPPPPPEERTSPDFILLALAVFAASYFVGDSSTLMPVDRLF